MLSFWYSSLTGQAARGGKQFPFCAQRDVALLQLALAGDAFDVLVELPVAVVVDSVAHLDGVDCLNYLKRVLRSSARAAAEFWLASSAGKHANTASSKASVAARPRSFC